MPGMIRRSNARDRVIDRASHIRRLIREGKDESAYKATRHLAQFVKGREAYLRRLERGQ